MLIQNVRRPAQQAVLRSYNKALHGSHHSIPSTRRTFFASSTDHSTLLQTAEIHKLQEHQSNSDHCQYVMVAEGMDADMVQKVPQLHLARLFRNGTTLFGAKVVNSTLGAPKEVCGRLVDAALEDIPTSTTIQAKSSLRGLSEWVQKGLVVDDGGTSIAALSSFNEEQIKAIQAGFLAYNKSNIDNALFELGKQSWEDLAHEFLTRELGDEAALYQSKGFALPEIIHHADESDYASSSGGAMALFILT